MGRAIIIPKFGTLTFGTPNVMLEVTLLELFTLMLQGSHKSTAKRY